MITQKKRFLRNTVLWCLLACCGGFLSQSHAYAVAMIEGIDIDSMQGTLQIELSERTPYKVFKLDARQVMVAFRSVDISSALSENRSGDQLVKMVKVETLPDQVVSLMIDTGEDIGDVQADWQNDSETLVIRLVPSGAASSKMISRKQKRFTKNSIPVDGNRIAETIPDAVAQERGPGTSALTDRNETLSAKPEMVPEPVAVPLSESSVVSMPAASAPPPKQESGLDGMITEIARSECSQSPILQDALKLAERKEWNQLFELLGPVLDPNSTDMCQSDLYYLRAFASFRLNQSGSDRLYLEAANYFQDAASYFPEAPYTPYGLLALATIYNDMSNLPEAKGYYNILLKSYADHPVYAEALFRLGELYVKEGKQNQAITTFRKFIEEYPKSTHMTDARLALGKCLYETNEFTEALAMLQKVAEENPPSIYKDPDLLVYIGNLNYQLGNVESAREAMIKAVNLYPESDSAPDLLTRIADTFKSDNHTEQAKKIYQLVMAMYPGTDGFAISAVRYAGMLSDPAEKKEKYQEIIRDFPGHPMAKLAVIRLADLQSQAGEYEASIDTLRGIMSGNLKDLQNETAYAMESAFSGFFRQLADGDNPITVISAYEKDKHMINRLDNPGIFELVGTAFFKAHLYSQAAELFQKSYKLSSPDNRTESLYYRLGVTFQELGKNMQAKEMLDAYFQKVPDRQALPDACLRMGQLLIEENSWENAVGFLKIGIRNSESDLERADLLAAQAEVYQNHGEEAKAPGLLIEAINLMASSPEVQPEQLMQVHRSLGESYLRLYENDKAIDAFTMALKFSTEGRPPGLLFLLAESNMKAHRSEAAKDVFMEIINSGDDFWGRMAQERLRTMELEVKLEES